MEGRESKLRTALSWADEVEKEEAEAAVARHQVQGKPKPNPFGSARPREVVLQERGIHMDPDLQSPPSLSVFRNGAQLRDNIPAVRKEAISPQFLSIFHHPESAIFDPPLRYPPKNVMAAILGTAYVGCKRKGTTVGNERRWRNKEDDDRRKRGPTRPPLVEATQNRLHQNESNQNKIGFQNQNQWIIRGKKHGANQVCENNRAGASHSMKMKSTEGMK